MTGLLVAVALVVVFTAVPMTWSPLTPRSLHARLLPRVSRTRKRVTRLALAAAALFALASFGGSEIQLHAAERTMPNTGRVYRCERGMARMVDDGSLASWGDCAMTEAVAR